MSRFGNYYPDIKNMDLHEFLLNKGIDPLVPIVTSSGDEVFLSDLIEEYRRENIIYKESAKHAKYESSKNILKGLYGLCADEPFDGIIE